MYVPVNYIPIGLKFREIILAHSMISELPYLYSSHLGWRWYLFSSMRTFFNVMPQTIVENQNG